MKTRVGFRSSSLGCIGRQDSVVASLSGRRLRIPCSSPSAWTCLPGPLAPHPLLSYRSLSHISSLVASTWVCLCSWFCGISVWTWLLFLQILDFKIPVWFTLLFLNLATSVLALVKLVFDRVHWAVWLFLCVYKSVRGTTGWRGVPNVYIAWKIHH